MEKSYLHLHALFIITFSLVLTISIIPALPFANADSEQNTDRKSLFELLMTAPDERIPGIEPPSIPSEQLQDESSSPSCKPGLTIVIKATDGSPKCVKPTTMFKLIERNWILIREAFAQPTEDTVVTPDTSDRAMFFSVRASGGILEREITSNFQKFTPLTDTETPVLRPDNPVDRGASSYQFALESLPSKDKLDFYKFMGQILAQSPIAREPIDVEVDIVSGDGTVLQTWAYRDCEITNYVTYLQDTVFFFQFSKGFDSEIRDRTLVDCIGLDLEVPE